MKSRLTIVKAIIFLITLAFVAWKGNLISLQIVSASGIIFLIVDIYAANKRRKQMKSLCEEIDKVLHNDYSMIIHDYSEGELSLLRSEIHKMTIRLKEQAESLKKDKTYLMDAMADVSHQLKTPLTSVNLILSLLMKENLCYEERMELVHKLNQSMQHIEWLIATLLKLSKFDADTVTFQKKAVSVQELAEKSYEPLAIAMDLKEQRFLCKIEDQASFTGDFAWSLEALENILKNCMEHTPTGGAIQLSASENTIYTMIEISDNGTGIDEKDIPHIFERFYRGNQADSKSVGIGLSLAQMIIRRQNGVIAVRNNKDRGVTFTIKIYKSVI